MLSSRITALRSLSTEVGNSQTVSRSGNGQLARSSVARSATLRKLVGFPSGVRSATSSASSGSPTPYYREVSRIRSSFLDFFSQNGHAALQSSNIVPRDASLLFTSAGMVQFKESFLGLRQPPSRAITTVQKCVRAGGKHNDLENVGFTARHHTFFEMLGNFSFGAYDKREAMRLAWLYLTKELGLPKERLSVTVLHGDEHTRQAWKDVASVTNIRECGEEDNFWSMGDVGPCGPCSEIFWDQLEPIDGERYLEIWNLVFMQNNAAKVLRADGSGYDTVISELPVPCIDTGMGLERLASVLQGKRENYQIDSLYALLVHTQSVIESRLGRALKVGDPAVDAALRVIVDHVRSASFLIAEGLMPSNAGRGYVLRRIIRRATRYSQILGMDEPILAEIFPVLAATMADAYPELNTRRNHIINTLTAEETSFFGNLHKGLHEITKLFMSAYEDEQKQRVVPGEEVFKLYETFGFPVDLTDLIARERGWSVDMKGFERVFEEQRAKDRLTWRGSGDAAIPAQVTQWTSVPKFTGYENMEEPHAEILEVHQSAKDEFWVSIDPCPFYAESGGQLGDRGMVIANDLKFDVIDAIQPFPKGIALKLKVRPDESKILLPTSLEDFVAGTIIGGANLSIKAKEALAVGATINAQVNPQWRRNIRRNHTATHLLHAALRQVLGNHVVQAGSRVADDSLRFDFAHYAQLDSEQLAHVEALVNDAIQAETPLRTDMMKYEEATKTGAMALFSEKYDQESLLRVVSLPGRSVELCGGTHVSNAAEIGLFKITGESSVGTGVRRIEATTGAAAIAWLQQRSQMVETLADMLNARADMNSIPTKVEKLLQGRKESKKEIEKLKEHLLSASTSSPMNLTFSTTNATTTGEGGKTVYEGSHSECGLPVLLHYFKSSGGFPLDLKSIRTAGDKARADHPDKIHALISEEHLLICSSNSPSKDLLKNMLKDCGVVGGGPPNMVSGSIVKAGIQKTLSRLIEMTKAVPK